MNSTDNGSLKKGKKIELIIIAVAAIFTIAVMALLLSSHMNKTTAYINEPDNVETATVSEGSAETVQPESETVSADEVLPEEANSEENASESVEVSHRKKDEIISKITSLKPDSKSEEVISESDLGIDDAKDVVYGACREMDVECFESKENSEGSFSCISSGYISDTEINNESEEPTLRYMRFDYSSENRTLQTENVQTPIDHSGGDVIKVLEEIEKKLSDEYEGFYITIIE